ncbi:MAG: ribonuclease HI family protein [Dehalococcoidales bacterium]|nr:ribonuclease HI family protein [Dehalococcoidales bacterium]
MKVIIHTDGASRGNPGQAAIGITIKDEKGNLLKSVSRAIGITTNNQAEYMAIIVALEQAIRLGAKHVELNSDSELVVFQLTGRYRVKKDTLKPLFQKVKELSARFESFKVKNIPREQNSEADALANKAYR